jgi:hypothetical protein
MVRPTAGGSGIKTTLVPLPHTRSTRWAVFFAEVGDVGAGGFEDPQAEQPEHGYQGERAWVLGVAGRGKQGLELQVSESQGG